MGCGPLANREGGLRVKEGGSTGGKDVRDTLLG